MQIILASQSPRRHELLELVKIPHKVVPSNSKEIHKESSNPEDIVVDISLQKAREVAQRFPNDLIIGADTIVVINNEILGKPHNEMEARTMLYKLSGNTHYVLTGVTVIYKDTIKQFVEKSEVTFCKMTEEEITDYIHNENVYDKAGSYAIQGMCSKYIESIKGDYYNIMGLPVCKLYHMLKEIMNK
ncbi:MAG: Maf family protein [Bacilli bacterium]